MNPICLLQGKVIAHCKFIFEYLTKCLIFLMARDKIDIMKSLRIVLLLIASINEDKRKMNLVYLLLTGSGKEESLMVWIQN